jgi:hypothetical protein
MKTGLWNDEDKLFVPKAFGLGYTINLKYVAKHLGLIKSSAPSSTPDSAEEDTDAAKKESHEDRLRRQIESSKIEKR